MAGSADLVLGALAANRAFAEELQRSLDALDAEERALQAAIQTLRQSRAMRRAERAMLAIGWDSDAPAAEAASRDVFSRDSESRYKRVAAPPRSFIRKQPSFFYSAPEKPAAPAKRVRRKPRLPLPGAAPVVDLTKEQEPLPNRDTVRLRGESHEAFIATPAKVFTPKEREIVRRFAKEHTPDEDYTREIPLETWNLISKMTKPPIHRSGFACKLWWELHENPTVRLGAWTKAEDEALKALASGAVDPRIVNNWAEIARRMPIAGRPPVHCLTRYMTKLCPANLNDKFTPEEDEMLRQAVEVLGEKWTMIADFMDGRIAEQLRHRWQLSLNPHVKLGKFSVMEDRRLLLALYAYYDRDEMFNRDTVQWQQICHHLAGRPPPPVRDRFLMSINPEVTFREWTAEEDHVVRSTIETHGFDLPGLWPRIAAELGNRTDNQVSRRARTLMAKEYKEYKEAKERAGGDRTLPVIFARMSGGRRDSRVTATHEKRSSYNGADYIPEDETEEEEQQSDPSREQIQL